MLGGQHAYMSQITSSPVVCTGKVRLAVNLQQQKPVALLCSFFKGSIIIPRTYYISFHIPNHGIGRGVTVCPVHHSFT